MVGAWVAAQGQPWVQPNGYDVVVQALLARWEAEGRYSRGYPPPPFAAAHAAPSSTQLPASAQVRSVSPSDISCATVYIVFAAVSDVASVYSRPHCPQSSISEQTTALMNGRSSLTRTEFEMAAIDYRWQYLCSSQRPPGRWLVGWRRKGGHPSKSSTVLSLPRGNGPGSPGGRPPWHHH